MIDEKISIIKTLCNLTRCDGSEDNSVPTQPTFSQWDPAFSLYDALWHCLRGISCMPSAMSTRRPRPASGFSHALRHCPRGISYMPLALSTRRPRSASGSRPSRSHMPSGTDHEAPTFSQWVPAFSLLLLLWHGQRGDTCWSIAWRTDSGNDLMVLSTVLTTRLALAKLSKSAPRTCPQRDQDCALLMFTKTFCSFGAPNKDRVGVSAHNPGTPAGVTTHAFRK